MASPPPPETAVPEPEPLDPETFSAFRRLATDPTRRLVVSLGGGSVPGLAGNCALVSLLEDLELRPYVREVWGTSAGAAVGGAWASGTPLRTILGHLMGLDRRGAVDVDWVGLGKAVLLRAFGKALPDGLIRGQHFSETVQHALSQERFEDCDIPFRCIACSDDGQARTKVFRRGLLEPAIFASLSLPGVIVPRRIDHGDDHGYYDGGLVEKTPLLSVIAEHLRGGHRERLLVVGTHFASETRRSTAEGFLSRFIQTIYALEDLAWGYQLQEVRARKDVDLLILNPALTDPKLFDFSRILENFQNAREAFTDRLRNARLMLSLGVE